MFKCFGRNTMKYYGVTPTVTVQIFRVINYYMSRNMRKHMLLICAPSEDSNQPAHPCSLISLFVLRFYGPVTQMFVSLC